MDVAQTSILEKTYLSKFTYGGDSADGIVKHVRFTFQMVLTI